MLSLYSMHSFDLCYLPFIFYLMYWLITREISWIWLACFVVCGFIIAIFGVRFVLLKLLPNAFEWYYIESGWTFCILSWIVSAYIALNVFVWNPTSIEALVLSCYICLNFMLLFMLGIRMCCNKFEGWRALCAGMPAMYETLKKVDIFGMLDMLKLPEGWSRSISEQNFQSYLSFIVKTQSDCESTYK